MKKNVLAAIDLTHLKDQKHILEEAKRFVDLDGGTLNVMTVLPPLGGAWVATWFKDDAEENMLQEADKTLHTFVNEALGTDVKARHIVSHGTVYEEILEMADRLSIDLIVMGAHRPELSDYLLGPNAARVARHSKCSVYIVRE